MSGVRCTLVLQTLSEEAADFREQPLPSTPLSTSEPGLVTENLHDKVGSVNRRAEHISRMTIFGWDNTALASGIVLALAKTQVSW